ncbi:MAG: hypothetical protein KJZ83_00130 [Burkholderiaceae bacterium]|nr:hypothetical protein [Burkholderiaceae bacterium]
MQMGDNANAVEAERRGLDDQPADALGNGTLEKVELIEIGAEFLSLQLRLGTMLDTQQKAWPGAAWTEELEQQWARRVTPIYDRIAELRWAAVRCPANSLAELRTKATILMDVVEDDSGDVTSQLTMSLCRDLVGAD